MNKYCCEEMKESGWYINYDLERFDLEEEYSCHHLVDIKFCPWCGKEIKND